MGRYWDNNGIIINRMIFDGIIIWDNNGMIMVYLYGTIVG